MENIFYRKLSAVGITSVFKIHLSDFIRICLNKNWLAGILKSSNSAVFIGEVWHTKYNTIVFAFMGLEPLGIFPAFLAEFHRTVTCHIHIGNKIVITCIGNSFYHFFSRACNKAFGEKTSISEIKSKCHFFHMYNLLNLILNIHYNFTIFSKKLIVIIVRKFVKLYRKYVHLKQSNQKDLE